MASGFKSRSEEEEEKKSDTSLLRALPQMLTDVCLAACAAALRCARCVQGLLNGPQIVKHKMSVVHPSLRFGL